MIFGILVMKSNKDQLKAVTGICFMLGVLTIIGLYSNLI